MAALDFTSALYLGLSHPSPALRPWDELTTGRPSALCVPAASRRLAAGLAQLLGCPRAILARSTLHAFVDAVAALLGPADAVLMDAGAYPVGGWALARSPVPVAEFAHHDPDALADRLAVGPIRRLRPTVVTDGWCPGCGGAAPLADYLAIVRRHGGRLLVDDTQALGVLGDGPGRDQPYGLGGGGLLQWANVPGPNVLVVSSLAKGFGAPLALVAGGASEVARVEEAGPSAMHSSPPSCADLHAGERALVINHKHGDRLRAILAGLVRRLRRRAAQLGVHLLGGLFPVQSLPAMDEGIAREVHRRLFGSGIRAVLQRPRCRPGATVTLLVTARHRPGHMDRAAEAMAAALGNDRNSWSGGGKGRVAG